MVPFGVLATPQPQSASSPPLLCELRELCVKTPTPFHLHFHISRATSAKSVQKISFQINALPTLPSSVSSKSFVCRSYENCRVTSFEPRVFLFSRLAPSFHFSLFAPRVFHNPFDHKQFRTPSNKCRVHANNSHSGTHLPPRIHLASQSLAQCPFCNPFVLMVFHLMGGR